MQKKYLIKKIEYHINSVKNINIITIQPLLLKIFVLLLKKHEFEDGLIMSFGMSCLITHVAH